MIKQLIILFSIIFLSSTPQRNIHERWSIELNKFVDDKGGVNYVKWKENTLGIDAYIEVLKKNHPENHWNKNEIMSYWINTYNALTIKLILNNYPTNSIRNLKNPWSIKVINFDSKAYSLDEIEHDILRKMGDPRIHFAINCASISCPNLSNTAYFSYKINDQLDNATNIFLNDLNKNEITKNEIRISKIFLWFKKDFGGNKNLINFINKYSLIKTENPKVKYLPYDWNLNVQ